MESTSLTLAMLPLEYGQYFPMGLSSTALMHYALYVVFTFGVTASDMGIKLNTTLEPDLNIWSKNHISPKKFHFFVSTSTSPPTSSESPSLITTTIPSVFHNAISLTTTAIPPSVLRQFTTTASPFVSPNITWNQNGGLAFAADGVTTTASTTNQLSSDLKTNNSVNSPNAATASKNIYTVKHFVVTATPREKYEDLHELKPMTTDKSSGDKSDKYSQGSTTGTTKVSLKNTGATFLLTWALTTPSEKTIDTEIITTIPVTTTRTATSTTTNNPRTTSSSKSSTNATPSITTVTINEKLSQPSVTTARLPPSLKTKKTQIVNVETEVEGTTKGLPSFTTPSSDLDRRSTILRLLNTRPLIKEGSSKTTDTEPLTTISGTTLLSTTTTKPTTSKAATTISTTPMTVSQTTLPDTTTVTPNLSEKPIIPPPPPPVFSTLPPSTSTILSTTQPTTTIPATADMTTAALSTNEVPAMMTSTSIKGTTSSSKTKTTTTPQEPTSTKTIVVEEMTLASTTTTDAGLKLTSPDTAAKGSVTNATATTIPVVTTETITKITKNTPVKIASQQIVSSEPFTNNELTATSKPRTIVASSASTTTPEPILIVAGAESTVTSVPSTTVAESTTTTVAEPTTTSVSSTAVPEPTTTTVAEPTTTTVAEPPTTTVAEPTTTSVPSTTVPEPTTTTVAEPATTTVAEPATTTVAEPATTTVAESATTIVAESATTSVPSTTVGEPTSTTVAEPTTTTVAESATTTVAESATASVPRTTVAEPTTTAVAEPTTTTVAEPTTTTVAEPTTTTVAESATTSVPSTTVAEPTTTAVAEPTTTAVAEPTTTAVAEPVTTTVAEPVTTTVAKPVTTTVAEPATASIPSTAVAEPTTASELNAIGVSTEPAVSTESTSSVIAIEAQNTVGSPTADITKTTSITTEETTSTEPELSTTAQTTTIDIRTPSELPSSDASTHFPGGFEQSFTNVPTGNWPLFTTQESEVPSTAKQSESVPFESTMTHLETQSESMTEATTLKAVVSTMSSDELSTKMPTSTIESFTNMPSTTQLNTETFTTIQTKTEALDTTVAQTVTDISADNLNPTLTTSVVTDTTSDSTVDQSPSKPITTLNVQTTEGAVNTVSTTSDASDIMETIATTEIVTQTPTEILATVPASTSEIPSTTATPSTDDVFTDMIGHIEFTANVPITTTQEPVSTETVTKAESFTVETTPTEIVNGNPASTGSSTKVPVTTESGTSVTDVVQITVETSRAVPTETETIENSFVTQDNPATTKDSVSTEASSASTTHFTSTVPGSSEESSTDVSTATQTLTEGLITTAVPSIGTTNNPLTTEDIIETQSTTDSQTTTEIATEIPKMTDDLQKVITTEFIPTYGFVSPGASTVKEPSGESPTAANAVSTTKSETATEPKTSAPDTTTVEIMTQSLPTTNPTMTTTHKDSSTSAVLFHVVTGQVFATSPSDVQESTDNPEPGTKPVDQSAGTTTITVTTTPTTTIPVSTTEALIMTSAPVPVQTTTPATAPTTTTTAAPTTATAAPTTKSAPTTTTSAPTTATTPTTPIPTTATTAPTTALPTTLTAGLTPEKQTTDSVSMSAIATTFSSITTFVSSVDNSTPAAEVQTHTVHVIGNFTISKGVTWKEQLANISSTEYIDLSKRVTKQLQQIWDKSAIGNYEGLSDMRFAKGSVKVQYKVKFSVANEHKVTSKEFNDYFAGHLTNGNKMGNFTILAGSAKHTIFSAVQAKQVKALPNWGIAVIVCGCVLFLFIVFMVCVLWSRRHIRQKFRIPEDPEDVGYRRNWLSVPPYTSSDSMYAYENKGVVPDCKDDIYKDPELAEKGGPHSDYSSSNGMDMNSIDDSTLQVREASMFRGDSDGFVNISLDDVDDEDDIKNDEKFGIEHIFDTWM